MVTHVSAHFLTVEDGPLLDLRSINDTFGDVLRLGVELVPQQPQIPASCRALVLPKLPLDLDVAEVEGGVVYRVEQARCEGPVLAVTMQPAGGIGGEVGVRQPGK